MVVNLKSYAYFCSPSGVLRHTEQNKRSRLVSSHDEVQEVNVASVVPIGPEGDKIAAAR
jgi:hypothetical protein